MTALLLVLLTPICLALLSGFVHESRLRALNFWGSLGLLLAAMWLILEVVEQNSVTINFGGWPFAYAIIFSADALSALIVLAVALVLLSVLLLWDHWSLIRENRLAFILTQGMVTSVIAVAVTADLFNLYVWFELMLISLLGLLVIQDKLESREAAMKYFILSMLGTLLMLSAIGLIYGTTGHLNFEQLANAAQNPEIQTELGIFSALFILALLMKVGAFPVFFWLPASYHTLPLPLMALVGGLLTKVTIYVLVRLSGFVLDLQGLYYALGWLAVLTMLSGVIGAAYHWDLRRILAFHIVSQVGFLLLGVALASQAAIVGTMVFLIHNILVKSNLLLIAGAIFWVARHYDLRCLGGLYPRYSLLAVLFLINAMALVGVPPTSGFWGKFLILQEAFHQQYFIWALAALVTGLLTLYSMSKIWLEAFWKPVAPCESCFKSFKDSAFLSRAPQKSIPLKLYIPIILLTIAVLVTGFYPEPIIKLLQNSTVTLEGAFYAQS